MSSKCPVVLVVEDDVEMNDLERELLAVHGFGSIPAYTGLEAVAVCRQGGADAVLLDIMLPGMNGFQACRLLRQEIKSKLPIIAVSALTEKECRQEGFASGVDAYFSKPFDPDEIISTLRRLLDAK